MAGLESMWLSAKTLYLATLGGGVSVYPASGTAQPHEG